MIPKLLLLLCLTPLGLIAQNYHHYTSENDAGQYGLLRRNLTTKVVDTLVPYEYESIWIADEYFVLIDGKFTEYRDGEAWGNYYSGRVVDQDLTELRSFDTISKLPLTTGRDRCTFKFKENGKEGFFSGAFHGDPWTGLYDEIDVTREKKDGQHASIKTPGYNWHRCGIVGIYGDKKILIGPLGDTIVECAVEDSISIWWQRYFEVYNAETASSALYTAQGELIEEGIISKTHNSGPGSTMYVFNHLDNTQSLWTGSGQKTPPIPYDINADTFDKDPYIIGKNKDGEHYKLDWDGTILAGPFEEIFKLFDAHNEAVKKDGQWHLAGSDVANYQAMAFDSIVTLTQTRNSVNYICYLNKDAVVISVGASSSGRYRKFWSAKIEGHQVEEVDGVIIVQKDGFWARLTNDGMSAFVFDRFESMPSSNYLKARIKGSAVLVDFEGNILFNGLNLKDIIVHNCETGNLYELIGTEKLGYYISGMNVEDVEMIYDAVDCGDYGYCLKKGKKWGLIDYEGNLSLDFKYKLKKVQHYEPEEDY